MLGLFVDEEYAREARQMIVGSARGTITRREVTAGTASFVVDYGRRGLLALDDDVPVSEGGWTPREIREGMQAGKQRDGVHWTDLPPNKEYGYCHCKPCMVKRGELVPIYAAQSEEPVGYVEAPKTGSAPPALPAKRVEMSETRIVGPEE